MGRIGFNIPSFSASEARRVDKMRFEWMNNKEGISWQGYDHEVNLSKT